MAYEMMQTNRLDASDSYYSLDDIYYFGGQNAHNRRAIMDHAPRSTQEIAFQVSLTTLMAQRINYYKKHLLIQ